MPPSPLVWYGGKHYLLNTLLPILEQIPHHTYVEPFGGAGWVLLAKRPVPVEVFNDIDEYLIDFFRVVADPNLFQQFFRRVSALPFSRQLFYECRQSLEATEDIVERAVKWFVVVRQSFGGKGKGGGWKVGIFKSYARAWMAAIALLPEVHQRLQRVAIENYDFRKVFALYDSPSTLFYCDPPYVPETRGSPSVYRHEMTLEDHQELVQILLSLQGYWVLSGYEHEVYQPLIEAGCRVVSKPVALHVVNSRQTGGKRPLRQEMIYICPKAKEQQQRSLWEEG